MCRDHVWPDRKWATAVFAVSLKRQRKSRKSLRLHQHLLNISWYLSHDLSADVNIHSTKGPPRPPVRANQHQAAVRASNGGDVTVWVVGVYPARVGSPGGRIWVLIDWSWTRREYRLQGNTHQYYTATLLATRLVVRLILPYHVSNFATLIIFP